MGRSQTATCPAGGRVSATPRDLHGGNEAGGRGEGRKEGRKEGWKDVRKEGKIEEKKQGKCDERTHEGWNERTGSTRLESKWLPTSNMPLTLPLFP